MPSFKLNPPFNIWIDTPRRYKIAYGGRGGGKTVSIANALLGLSYAKKGTFLCARQTQTSIDDSVYPLLKELIYEYKLENDFEITRKSLVNKVSGVNFIFTGLLLQNIASVKSIHNITLCWIEEAEVVDAESWQILTPSVRGKDSEIWVSFNPRSPNSVFYREVKRFEDKLQKKTLMDGRYVYHEYIDDNYIITKLNFDGNIYFDKNGVLEQERRLTEKYNPNLYAHIWLGDVSKEEGALFRYDDVMAYDIGIAYDKYLYEVRVVAIDPAMSHKDFANEYGIKVGGRTYDKDVHEIKDFSSVYNAHDFAKATSYAYETYECSACIIEDNIAGDHIIEVLLTYNPTINIVRVRATANKQTRALVVANLLAQGRIHSIEKDERTEQQMLNMTIGGYKGIKGESPDRLDALGHLVDYLFDLKGSGTSDAYFKFEYFQPPTSNYKLLEKIAYISIIDGLAYIWYMANGYYGAKAENDLHIVLYDTAVSDINKLQTLNYENIDKVYILSDIKIDLGDVYIYHINFKHTFNLSEMALKCLPIIQDGYVLAEASARNTLIRNVCNYNKEMVNKPYLTALLEFIIFKKDLDR